MRVAAFSDTHASPPPIIHDVGLILCVGDLLGHSSPTQYNLEKELAFLNRVVAPWVEKVLKTSEFYLVWGNHDLIGERHPELVPQIIRERTLTNRLVEVNGVSLYGTPYQPRFYDWGFNMEDTPEGLGLAYSSIPNKVDILLTHCPAYGTLDQIDHKGEHLGSRQLRKRIDQIQIKFHCAGHIHTGRGIQQRGNYTAINCSLMNEEYSVVNPPIIFEV